VRYELAQALLSRVARRLDCVLQPVGSQHPPHRRAATRFPDRLAVQRDRVAERLKHTAVVKYVHVEYLIRVFNNPYDPKMWSIPKQLDFHNEVFEQVVPTYFKEYYLTNVVPMTGFSTQRGVKLESTFAGFLKLSKNASTIKVARAARASNWDDKVFKSSVRKLYFKILRPISHAVMKDYMLASKNTHPGKGFPSFSSAPDVVDEQSDLNDGPFADVIKARAELCVNAMNQFRHAEINALMHTFFFAAIVRNKEHGARAPRRCRRASAPVRMRRA